MIAGRSAPLALAAALAALVVPAGGVSPRFFRTIRSPSTRNIRTPRT
jgi:hypothetical protein